ncbi:MAG: lipoate protein ligase C-terminal domain-containing protein [Dysosmobacter welbionis]
MRREARFPAGLVTAHLRVKQGCIQAVRFYGDFFGSGPLEELEAAMAGLPLDAQLAEALAPLHVEHYMSGITAEELARLLRGEARGAAGGGQPSAQRDSTSPGRRTGPDTAHGTAPVPLPRLPQAGQRAWRP